MPYRVQQDGAIEADTAEEAIILATLFQKPRVKRSYHRKVVEQKSTPDKFRVGQLWQKYGKGRIVQIEQLLEDGIMPRIIKESPGNTRPGHVRKIGYAVFDQQYKLIKDI